jgi:pimeloyl-ACP methyl ester carboxylesterase
VSQRALNDGAGEVTTARGHHSFWIAGASQQAGAPLVLLPSLGGAAQKWGAFGRRLAAERCIIALDPPGFGRSSPPPAWLTTRVLAVHLLAALDALRVERFDLLGCSLGGLVAMRAASMAPERIEKLVLASVAERGRDFAPRSPALALRLVHDFVTSPRPKRDIARDIAASDGREKATTAVADASWSRGRLLHFLGAALAHDAGSDLRQLNMPVLLLHGEQDVLLGADAQQRLRERLPRAVLRTVPGVGHDLVNEAPDACAETVLQFLQKY